MKDCFSDMAIMQNGRPLAQKLSTPPGKTSIPAISLAIALPFIALVMQWFLWDYFKPYVWFLFFLATFFSAWIGGLAGGLAATLISTLLVWYFFIPPALSFTLKNPSAGYSGIIFIFMGGLFALFHNRLRREVQRTHAALIAAEDAKEEISQLYSKLHDLDAQKSAFFTNISHELRTPLTLLIAPLERRLKLASAADFSVTERNETELMLRNARLLYRHVADLLDAAKLDAGRMKPCWNQFDLVPLVLEVASHFESAADERSINYRISTPETLPIEADGEKLQRVLLNLLSNAFKFTPDGGAITLRLQREDDRALIDVQDNGPGIPPEQRETVFERFCQGESTILRSHSGTGLGLAIVKEFITLHGGSIELSEAPGGGALFSFHLPLKAPAGTQFASPQNIDNTLDKQIMDELKVRTPAVATTVVASNAPRVLVVEDNRDLNDFIVSVLSPYYRVDCASNGREGLEKAQALLPDLVLTDLMMPIMGGDEMALQLRRAPDTQDIPILILSAKADEKMRLQLLQVGIQHYLNKPFSTEELLARISSLIKKRQRTLAELDRRTVLLRRLAEVVEKIAAVRDLPSLMDIVRHAVRELTGADGSSLILRENGQCHYVDEDAIGPLWKGQHFPLEACISGWAMLHSQAVAIEDIYADPRIPHAAYRPTFVQSLSMVPIGREEPVGAIGCYWATQHLATSEELELQQALADAMSVGLANLKLYQSMLDARLAAEQSAAEAYESEQRFRATFEQAAVGIALVAPDGRWLRVNQKLCAIVGYSHDELMGKTFQDITHPDDLNSDLTQAQQVLDGKTETYSLEKRYLRKDAQIVWINLTVALVRQADGSPDYFISVIEDIQRRKQAEAALRESQGRLQLVLDATNDGLWDWDLRSGEVYRSPRYCELIGYPADQCSGGFEFFKKLVHPADLSRVLGVIDAHRLGKTEAIEYDFRLVTGSGEIKWMVAKGRAVERDSQGVALRIVGILMDIQQRKEIEAALRESQERLQLLIDHAPAALAMFDREMRYLAVSSRWIDDYALGEREILGKSHYTVLPDVPADWRAAHQRGLAGEIIRTDKDRFVRNDGSVQWLRWEIRPWHAIDGAIGGIVIFAEDITDQVVAQQEILQLNANLEKRVAERTAELTAANQDLDAFAYAVSHDLRAPLRAMTGFSQALSEDFADKLDGDAATYLQQIDIASRKMSKLIEAILALSRSTRGELRHEHIDLTALALDTLAELGQTEPERIVSIDVEPGMSINGDLRMVEVLMRNLLGNAWKYSGKTSTPAIRVYAGNVDGLHGICIADNGAGFDMSYADQLFQPFKRLHRQDEFPGIGIGLTTVQRIVRRHGGKICAQGEPGKGATFCFTLPGESEAA